MPVEAVREEKPRQRLQIASILLKIESGDLHPRHEQVAEAVKQGLVSPDEVKAARKLFEQRIKDLSKRVSYV